MAWSLSNAHRGSRRFVSSIRNFSSSAVHSACSSLARECISRSASAPEPLLMLITFQRTRHATTPVSYTHLRAHETVLDLVCRLLLEKKRNETKRNETKSNQTIPYHTIPYHTIPCHTMPYHTIPYHTMPYHAIPYHTIPYHTIPNRIKSNQTKPPPLRVFHSRRFCCFTG